MCRSSAGFAASAIEDLAARDFQFGVTAAPKTRHYPWVDVKQVARGSLRWLRPEEGGLKHPFPLDRWMRPARNERVGTGEIASLALLNIEPGAAVSNGVSAWWLMWEELPAEWTIREGDLLTILDGPSTVVAYLEVERVEEENQ